MENTEFSELVRPFAAGSRQTPDPYDRFLDDNGFYRKHTARDASSLFRVISEQVYEIQSYHERVRGELVDFMYANRAEFEPTVTCMGHDFDLYLADMSKPRTRGTVLELKAAGMLYACNVMLFEPLSMGRWLNRPHDTHTGTIRVFFTAPVHFDTVYEKEYMKKAAYCQAIVYEILYKDVFKLPDVDYAVEKMLHDPFNENIRVEMNEVTGTQTVHTGDGRQIGFDAAESTQCLLGDYRFCHFHNVEGFGTEIAKYMQQGKQTVKKNKPHLDLFLYDEKISCVRQLLEDGVTPFPYKVAKALDQSIYRNVEYDTWAEARRERKFRDWYFGGSDFKVSALLLPLNFNRASN